MSSTVVSQIKMRGMLMSLVTLFWLSTSYALVLHGTRSSRSPLINWYLEEEGISYEQASPRPSNHPFGQTPFLSDGGGVEVFESGAILLYLADKYGKGMSTPEERAKYFKWIVWSNSELDNLCFGGMRGTSLDKPNIKALDTLEGILGDNAYLVDDSFSIADVACASYLCYVPLFFGSKADLSLRPNMCRYMARCAARPAYAKAFGEDHAELVIKKAQEWTSSSSGVGAKKFGWF